MAGGDRWYEDGYDWKYYQPPWWVRKPQIGDNPNPNLPPEELGWWNYMTPEQIEALEPQESREARRLERERLLLEQIRRENPPADDGSGYG